MAKSKCPDKELASARCLVNFLLAADSTQYEPGHIKDLLSVLIWKITQAEGKHRLRFISKNARLATDKKKLIHEHVHGRKKLIKALLRDPSNIKAILDNAVACPLTTNDRIQLSKVHKSLEGWSRYKAAGIKVFDSREQKILNFAEMNLNEQ